MRFKSRTGTSSNLSCKFDPVLPAIGKTPTLFDSGGGRVIRNVQFPCKGDPVFPNRLAQKNCTFREKTMRLITI